MKSSRECNIAAYMLCGNVDVLLKAPGAVLQLFEGLGLDLDIVGHLLMQIPVQFFPDNLHAHHALV